MQAYELFKEHYVKKLFLKSFVKAAELLFIKKCFVSLAMKKDRYQVYVHILFYKENVLVKQGQKDVANMLLTACINWLIFLRHKGSCMW